MNFQKPTHIFPSFLHFFFMKKIKFSFPLILLLLISSSWLLSSLLEFRYIKYQQKDLKFQDELFNLSSLSYQSYKVISKFIQGISSTLFYLGLFFFSNAISSISNNDYEFCTYFIIARWVIVILPSSIIHKLLINQFYGINNITFSNFFKYQIIEQSLLLIFLRFSVFAFIYIGERLSPYSSDTTIISEDNFDFSSSSSYISKEDKNLPPLEVDKEPEPPLMRIFITFYCLLILIFCVWRYLFHIFYF